MPQKKEADKKSSPSVTSADQDKALKEIFTSGQETGNQPLLLPKKSGRIFPKIILGVVLAVVVITILGLVVMGLGVYKYNWQNSLTNNLVRWLGYPAVLLQYHGLSYGVYADDLKTLDHFYAAQAAQNPGASERPSADYLKKSVLSRMVREKFLDDKAKELGLTVTQEEIDNEFTTIVSQAGDATKVEETLKELYGWTPAQFKEKVLRAYLIRTKVQEQIAKDDTINVDVKKTAEEVLAKLNQGEKFEDLAKQYSEDTTASSGGDLGFFTSGQMVKEFEDAVKTLETGKTSGIVKTQYGYHIIKLLEKIPASGDKLEQWHAAHILIKSKDVDTWVNEELAKKKVMVLISGLTWHKDCGLVLAKSETCENNELLGNTANDDQGTSADTNENTNTADSTDSNANTSTNATASP